MKPKQSPLMVWIDKSLKRKMRDYYAKTEKSLTLQVTEALNLYFESQRPL